MTISRRTTLSLWLTALCAWAGCARLLDADFDQRHPADAAQTSGPSGSSGAGAAGASGIAGDSGSISIGGSAGQIGDSPSNDDGGSQNSDGGDDGPVAVCVDCAPG